MRKINFLITSILFGLLLVTCTSNIEETQELLKSSKSSTSRTTLSTPCDDCDSNSTFNYTNNDLINQQKRSVGLIYNTQTNQSYCTGTLINNTQGRLLLLTAAHCVEPELKDLIPPNQLDDFYRDRLSDVQLQSLFNQQNRNEFNEWGVRFEFECTSGGINNGFTVHGLKLVSFNYQTEMALFEITGIISDSNKEKLCLSGWDRSTVASSDESFIIQHPNGKPQRVAKSTNGYVQFTNSQPFFGFDNFNLDRNKFWYLTPEIGGFNVISSGSSLINLDEKIVGILSTGDPNTTINCERKSIAFSKLSEAWGYSATNSSSSLRTLKNWIGPTTSMDRHCFGTITPPSPVCNGSYQGASHLNIEIINPNCTFSQLTCGRVNLKWTIGDNVTYNIYRQVNRGALVKITEESLPATTSEFEDEEVRTWQDNVEIKYFVESVNACGETVSPTGTTYTPPNFYRINATTYGGLINL